MWRVHGLAGRVLGRCYGNTPLRLGGPHVEDEVISSSVLSTARQVSDHSSQSGEHGEKNKKRKTSQFCYSRLLRYSALDAVGWGLATMLFTQFCRRIHSQFFPLRDQSATATRLRDPTHISTCTYRVLLDTLSRHDVFLGGMRMMCLKGAPASLEHSSSSSSSSSVNEHSSVNEYSGSVSAGSGVNHQLGHTTSHQQGDTFSHGPTDIPVDSVHTPSPVATGCNPPQEESPHTLDEAAQNLKATADSSVPIILNIIGLESAKTGDLRVAFECFLASAQQGYSKAQFNVGVCYECGRGIQKDASKALQYYRCAAATGHTQAQYRYAKLFLDSRGQQSASDTDTSTALSLLHAAADAGLTEAQLYLGLLLSQGSRADAETSVHYFRMAAESGDCKGLLFLAQCYERGFGVGQCYSSAVGLYQQAADKGNQQAKSALRDIHSKEALRSIRSAPCLSVLDRLHLSTMFPQVFQKAGPDTKDQDDWPSQPLHHSYSTGNLVSPPLFSAETLNSHGWIIGVG
ncbi:death ligand signal enhancer [Brachyhypopomus gauderio]|uniref:death ligand signal enhancer n=1 Tax=Brachyhypopomus gauderio TaxID=698409 RepID=UPI0040438CF2